VEGIGVVGRNVPGVGIEVVAVREGTAAERAGLRRGDLIVALDGDREPDTALLTRRFRGDSPVTALVTVQRGGEHRVLALESR
jgi:C-terminal processing protease CtpA/Prc